MLAKPEKPIIFLNTSYQLTIVYKTIYLPQNMQDKKLKFIGVTGRDRIYHPPIPFTAAFPGADRVKTWSGDHHCFNSFTFTVFRSIFSTRNL